MQAQPRICKLVGSTACFKTALKLMHSEQESAYLLLQAVPNVSMFLEAAHMIEMEGILKLFCTLQHEVLAMLLAPAHT